MQFQEAERVGKRENSGKRGKLAQRREKVRVYRVKNRSGDQTAAPRRVPMGGKK